MPGGDQFFFLNKNLHTVLPKHALSKSKSVPSRKRFYNTRSSSTKTPSLVTLKTITDIYENELLKETELYEAIGEYLHAHEQILEPEYTKQFTHFSRITDSGLLGAHMKAKIYTLEGAIPVYIAGMLDKNAPIEFLLEEKRFTSKHLVYSEHLRIHPKTGAEFLTRPIRTKSIWEVKEIDAIQDYSRKTLTSSNTKK